MDGIFIWIKNYILQLKFVEKVPSKWFYLFMQDFRKVCNHSLIYSKIWNSNVCK